MKEFILYQFKNISVKNIKNETENILSDLKSRRSVREFSDKTIPLGIVKNLVNIASTAPSGANKQPWFFVIIRNKEIKRLIRLESEANEKINYESKFTEQMKKDFEQFKTNHVKPFLEEAPYLIVAFYEKSSIKDGKTEKNYYAIESFGIALGFLISAIHFVGLYTVVYTPSPMRFLNKLLNVDENFVPMAILPVGYPKEGIMVPDIDKKEFDDICKIF